ncbi:BQ2448_3022 [Microbotryum intermedium]|uniref:BQ2448_3022 protein n=1 Tax=Microbotryum intermedium TaxID=269621 RepID=A0A238FHS4_9BASI|nr:BQ2448_3022 [Microbotryum intermedium]
MSRLKILLAWSLLTGFAAARCSHRRHHTKIQATFNHPAVPSSTPKVDGPYLSLATTPGSSPPSSGSSVPSFRPNLNTKQSTAITSPASVGWGLDGVRKQGIALGVIPDDGKSFCTKSSSAQVRSGQRAQAQVINAPISSLTPLGASDGTRSGGGTRQTVDEINLMIGQRVSAQGYYAQVFAGRHFDGWQLLSKMDQIVRNGGVFQASVMPIGGWAGLTWKDNRQAVAICNVMKRFTDKNVEVWLRFAHEANWYQRDGTYEGSVRDFKEGWSVVAAACKQIAPHVKMWFTPNVATLEEYDRYYPDDHSTVHLIGIDYYPKVLSTANFVAVMKPLHDKYCKESGPYFAIGETGPGSRVSMRERMNWLKHILSPETKAQLPFFIAVTWFNLLKTGINYRIADASGDTSSAVKLFLDAADD